MRASKITSETRSAPVGNPRLAQRQPSQVEHQRFDLGSTGASILALVDSGAPLNSRPRGSSAINRQSLLRLQRDYGNHHVRRALAVHGQARSDDQVGPDVEAAIHRARGGGQALDGRARARMETAFGADFSGVRVHHGAESASLNRELGARAFAVGHDIFFGRGEYAPVNSDGQKLLAHELTHVVQQSPAAIIGDVERSDHIETARRAAGEGPLLGTQVEVTQEISSGRAQRQDHGAFDAPEDKKDEPRNRVKEAMGDPNLRTGFPLYFLELGDAYDGISAQIGMDARDLRVDSALLDTVKIPEDHKSAYERVLNDLRLEVNLKTNVRAFFQGMTDFVQNLHTSYQNRLEIVTKYLELQNSDVVNLFITRMISEGFEAIGELGGAPATLAAEALKVAWDTYKTASTAASANKVSIGVIDAINAVDTDFNGAITAIESMRNRALTDYAVLQRMGKLTWPSSTKAMRKTSGVAYEIGVWKQLLPIKWKVYHASDGAEFHQSIEFTERIQAKNPHVWHKVERVDEEHWYGDKHGWYVTEYWLGSGGSAFTHTTPDAKLVERIYSLGVSREELLMHWGLPTGIYVMPSAGGMGF